MNQLPLFTSEDENDLLALVVAIARAGSRAPVGAHGAPPPEVVAPQHGADAGTGPEVQESEYGSSPIEDDPWEPENRYWYWDDSDYAQEVCIKRWGEI